MFTHMHSKSETSVSLALQIVLQIRYACKLGVKYRVNFSCATVIILRYSIQTLTRDQDVLDPRDEVKTLHKLAEV